MKNRIVKTPTYNYLFNAKTGFFARWGKNKSDDPLFSPIGPEILDYEVSEICHGNCEFCAPAGTQISMDGLEKNIEDVKVGDMVFSKSTVNGIVNKEVLEIYKRKFTGELICVETEDGKTIKVTPEHPFILKNGQCVLAKDLTTDSDVVSIDEFKKCTNCGKIIFSKSYKRYYCSEKCYNEKHDNKCLICGKKFQHKNRKYFCENCVTSKKNSPANPLYNTWRTMLYRCYVDSRNGYAHYGEKNIKPDSSWLDFDTFLKDMGDRPDGFTLDRIDNNLGYSKKNCRWVSINEQRINRGRFKSTKRKYKGVSKYLSKYKAECRFNANNNYLGVFNTEKEAAIAYNNFIKKVYPDTYKNYINKVD